MKVRCGGDREKRDEREADSDGRRKTVRGNERVTHAGREKISLHTRTRECKRIYTYAHEYIDARGKRW